MCVFLKRKVASLLEQKNGFTWPGEPNTTHMARGLYFALPTMNKFFLLFLRGCYYNAKAGIFGWMPEIQDFLKQFCYSNLLYLFSFLFPSTPVMHLHIFRPGPSFVLQVHSLQTLLHAGDPLLPFPKGLLSQKILNKISPIGSIFCIFRKILFIFSSMRLFD